MIGLAAYEFIWTLRTGSYVTSGVTAATVLGRRCGRAGGAFCDIGGNKIAHGRVLIVLGLLGHRGILKSALLGPRGRRRRKNGKL